MIISIVMIIISCDSPPPFFNGSLCGKVCADGPLEDPQIQFGHIRPKRLGFGLRPPKEPPSERPFLFLNKFKYSERSGRSGGVPPPLGERYLRKSENTKSTLGMLGGSPFCANHTMK